MKMQCSCVAPGAGMVLRVAVQPGQFVSEGDLIMVIRAEGKATQN